VQALLVTVFGGLAMLLGFVLLGEAAGTYRISEILDSPPRGAMVAVALVLILLGVRSPSPRSCPGRKRTGRNRTSHRL